MEIAVKAKDGSITRLDITDEQANYLGLSAEGKPLYDTGFSKFQGKTHISYTERIEQDEI